MRKWITVTDDNWRTAVQWYRDCAELLGGLGESERNGYAAALLGNIRQSTEEYLPKAGLPTNDLQQQLGAVVDYLLYPKGMPISNDSHEESAVIGKTRQDALKQDLSEVIDFIFIAGFLSILLTFVLICIMCCYCCKYKRVRHLEREEIEKMLDSRHSCNVEKKSRESHEIH